MFTHECAHDILVVGRVEFLVWSLRQSANHSIHEEFKALNYSLFAQNGSLLIALVDEELLDIVPFQVKINFLSYELLGLAEALVDGGDRLVHHVEVFGAKHQRVTFLESRCEESMISATPFSGLVLQADELLLLR